ncbi:MAG: hypothetical protein DME36_02345 [Verrucomicrobia bacterium]|nr:MAG: hypothetical protein DME36_02345 [Verrucomicrobiota bacterium]
MNKQQNMMVGAPLRLFQLKTTTLSEGNSISRSPLLQVFLFIALALAWLALSPTARAVDPAPDGGYPNQNTAEGDEALFSLDTTIGLNNTAIGFMALHSLATGSEATATGSFALFNDTTGFNTAYGFSALYSNTTGFANTAIGRNAMLNHTTGDHNTATGGAALLANTNGLGNTATGRAAMGFGTTGSRNTATGWQALFNDTGDNNTGDGAYALFSNTTGHDNTAMGRRALDNNTTGNGNIALGVFAGANHTTGDFNIDIGNRGTAGEANTIRIGTEGTHVATFIAGISGATVAGGVTVIVDANGHLGTVVSSERFKDAIKPMDKSSEAILALQPVTFRYKHELDPVGIPQFGLVAEEVAKVSPDLVARDKEGKVYTVRYEAVNTMLLNEFLKEHRKVEEQEATITQVKSTVAKQEATIAQQQKNFQSTIAQQQKEIDALTTGLQKVSDELVLSKPAPQMVLNTR